MLRTDLIICALPMTYILLKALKRCVIFLIKLQICLVLTQIIIAESILRKIAKAKDEFGLLS